MIYGAPDLEAAVSALEVRTGVRAALGGRHSAYGTHNALLALGPRVYLEILAPDPRRDAGVEPTLFGLDLLAEPRMVAWAASCSDLGERVASAADAGLHLGEVQSGARETSDGGVLRWRISDPYVRHCDGVVPFLIDWGETPHPAASAPGGLRLLGLRATHPNAAGAQAALDALGVDLDVSRGDAAALSAIIEGPVGKLELA
ncbi:MAG: VOC family protein [Gemmatimonadota bacterium]